MLSLFFLYYSVYYTESSVCASELSLCYTNLSLWCGTIVRRTAPLERSFKIGNCLADIRRMKENSI